MVGFVLTRFNYRRVTFMSFFKSLFSKVFGPKPEPVVEKKKSKSKPKTAAPKKATPVKKAEPKVAKPKKEATAKVKAPKAPVKAKAEPKPKVEKAQPKSKKKSETKIVLNEVVTTNAVDSVVSSDTKTDG